MRYFLHQLKLFPENRHEQNRYVKETLFFQVFEHQSHLVLRWLLVVVDYPFPFLP